MKINSNIKFKEVELTEIPVGECFMFGNEIYIKTLGITNKDKGIVTKGVNLRSGRIVFFDETEIVNPIKAEINLTI